MPRLASTAQGSSGAAAFNRAQGVDDAWVTDALCRGLSSNRESRHWNAWYAEPRDTYERAGRRIPGYALLAEALMLCGECTVQWQCASYSFLTEDIYGAWGASKEDLKWLRKNVSQPLVAIEQARVRGESVQVMIRSRRGVAA